MLSRARLCSMCPRSINSRYSPSPKVYGYQLHYLPTNTHPFLWPLLKCNFPRQVQVPVGSSTKASEVWQMIVEMAAQLLELKGKHIKVVLRWLELHVLRHLR